MKKIDTILLIYSLSVNENTLTPSHLDRIRDAAGGARVVIVRNQEDWERTYRDFASAVDVVYGRLSANWFRELPRLRWVQLSAAGTDRLLLDAPEIATSDLILTNSSGTHAVQISEHVLALMLTLSRSIHLSLRRQLKHEWNRTAKTLELEGATMGLIGVGAIGARTAEKAKGLGMRVLGLRSHPDRAVPQVDRMLGPDGLAELLSQSDWVVITAALTSETRGMIGEPELQTMKKSAHIVNVARGAIIQEKSLIRALNEGWIAGAGLDVFEAEPLPDSSPLWNMDNVVVTPHHAGSSPNHINRLVDLFTENLERYRSGAQMINVVDKRIGY